ncbi:SWI/SNF-related matrix-associated actin-dependent regulator of chromatin subfamily A-like protein 1 [Cimex lectularius]|uniref:SWI/SNF-related matrix-associated actin-dependent regulator of chromatin subfamily A-like protein 1 n=1 Tax=Cimex lectularius TaxID=79782 RepID=A0A8I6RMX3_CIMLE|nr:SWI/SNF-related matrix-associated actin-dependent regulator of chromatin subfamily A-like protein 1 [Cimex lectularius]
MASTLTPEQRQRIEENRQKALAKLAAKSANQQKTPDQSYNRVQPVQQASSSLGNRVPFKNQSFQTKPATNGNQAQNFYKSKSLGSHTGGSKPEEKPKSWNVVSETLTGTCSLISNDRFAVTIGYNSKVIDIMKSIPGRQYDTNKKFWHFPLDQYDTLKSKLSPLSPSVIVGNIPKSVFKIIKDVEPVQDFKNIDISTIDPVLLESLFPFQVEGVKYGIFKHGKCLIADDMGLGKTLQALAIADYYYEDWPLMIVCPSSMRFQWQAEILKYLTKVPSYSILLATNGKACISSEYKVVILSYDLLVKFKEVLKKLHFGLVIFDESHSLKNAKTQRTKAALEISKNIKCKILLSGTPALSRPIELYPQIRLLEPSLFKEIHEYGVRYCDGKQDKFGWNFQGSSHLEELKIILEAKFMIRRLKANVLEQLPSKMRQVVTLNDDHIDMKSMKMKSLETKLNKNKNISGSDKRSTLLAYYAETGRAKIPAILKYIEDLLEKNKKFLCFAHHTDVLNSISDLLEKKEVYYIRIDGSVSSEERKSVCDQFQEEDRFRVAVLSITAANTGVTLTAAQLVVFAEIFWNPGELVQAEDRAHRIGQKSSVLVQYLLAKGTADDYLWPLVQSKLNILNQAGLSKETELSVKNVVNKSKLVQSSIMQYFSELDYDIDDNDLANLMDEIEGVPEKRKKLF